MSALHLWTLSPIRNCYALKFTVVLCVFTARDMPIIIGRSLLPTTMSGYMMSKTDITTLWYLPS